MMGIRSILATLFGSSEEQVKEASPGQIAVDRLTLILMHDRADI